jgi:hypothetical protein
MGRLAHHGGVDTARGVSARADEFDAREGRAGDEGAARDVRRAGDGLVGGAQDCGVRLPRGAG